MGLSPRSAVSSDQYSPSEQALPQGLPNQVQDGSPKQDSFSEQTPAGKEGSEYSDVVQGLSCVVDVASRPSSTITTPTLNGTLHESSHKRKREQDANTYLGTQEQSLKNHTHGEVVPPGNGNVQAGYQDHVLNQAEESTDDRARFKRSKTIKNEAVRTAAHLLCKSSALPSVLWQHIFCFVPPVFLGRLLRVNHAFNTYLTPSKSNQDVVRLTHSIMQPLDAEAIWVASRRRFCPGLPKPIHGLQELDMWKLLRGQDCQICGQIKAASPAVNAGHNWESGPGEFAVKVVWPFGVRCCGPCLQKISKKVRNSTLRWPTVLDTY